jgi:hypothetical protein
VDVTNTTDSASWAGIPGGGGDVPVQMPVDLGVVGPAIEAAWTALMLGTNQKISLCRALLEAYPIQTSVNNQAEMWVAASHNWFDTGWDRDVVSAQDDRHRPTGSPNCPEAVSLPVSNDNEAWVFASRYSNCLLRNGNSKGYTYVIPRQSGISMCMAMSPFFYPSESLIKREHPSTVNIRLAMLAMPLAYGLCESLLDNVSFNLGQLIEMPAGSENTLIAITKSKNYLLKQMGLPIRLKGKFEPVAPVAGYCETTKYTLSNYVHRRYIMGQGIGSSSWQTQAWAELPAFKYMVSVIGVANSKLKINTISLRRGAVSEMSGGMASEVNAITEQIWEMTQVLMSHQAGNGNEATFETCDANGNNARESVVTHMPTGHGSETLGFGAFYGNRVRGGTLDCFLDSDQLSTNRYLLINIQGIRDRLNYALHNGPAHLMVKTATSGINKTPWAFNPVGELFSAADRVTQYLSKYDMRNDSETGNASSLQQQ